VVPKSIPTEAPSTLMMVPDMQEVIKELFLFCFEALYTSNYGCCLKLVCSRLTKEDLRFLKCFHFFSFEEHFKFSRRFVNAHVSTFKFSRDLVLMVRS
jgi:hypothetical protein